MNTEEITKERLARWAVRLESQHATPLVLVGIGHDHVSGNLVVCLPEDVGNPIVIALLLRVIEGLSQ
jgi:hypothetical protein